MEQVRDEFLLEEVKNALTRELINSDIDINVEKGEVTLTGIVDVLAEKRFAEEVVERISGVKWVENSITIAIDNTLTDKETADEIIARLTANPLEQLHSLGVDCKNGTVILKGHVNNAAERNAALQAASQVRGIKEVISHLSMNKEVDDRDDASICNDVERALSLSKNINPDDVFTQVRHGEVYLSGWLDTKDNIEEAIQRASSVIGVKKVHSKLHHAKDNTGDVKLTNQIRSLLGKHKLNQVKAFVVDGTVFLGGQVYSVDQKAEAEELARTLSGINGISNDINVAIH